ASVEERDGGKCVSLFYKKVGGLDVDVTVSVRASRAAPGSRWGITVRNGAGLRIVDVQFPFVVCRYDLGGEPGSETLVLPHDFGRILRAPTFEKIGPDSPLAWQLTW